MSLTPLKQSITSAITRDIDSLFNDSESDLDELLQRLSAINIIDTNRSGTPTRDTREIQNLSFSIEHPVFEYHRYYSESDLFGCDSDGNMIIGFVHSPKRGKNGNKNDATQECELFRFPDPDTNTAIQHNEPTLSESTETDEMYNANRNALLLKENERQMERKLRKKHKRLHKRKRTSTSSIELPIPSKSDLEIQLEEEQFGVNRQTYIAQRKEPNMSKPKCDNDTTVYKGKVLEFDTKKILKGIKRQKSAIRRHSPSELFTNKSMDSDECVNAYEGTVENDWKKQYTQLSEEYSDLLAQNQGMIDRLCESEKQCMELLMDCEAKHRLIKENKELKERLLKYEGIFGRINEQITWIDSVYKVQKWKRKRNESVSLEESINESVMMIDSGTESESTEATTDFSNETTDEGSESDSNESILSLLQMNVLSEIEKEECEMYQFVDQCRHIFKVGNGLSHSLSMELIETCHKSMDIFFEIKDKFVEFIKESERISNSKIWMEQIQKAKTSMEMINALYQKPLNYTFYEGCVSYKQYIDDLDSHMQQINMKQDFEDDIFDFMRIE